MGEIMVILSGLLIGIAAISVGFQEISSLSSIQIISMALLGGIAGSHFDSFLGATVQGMNKCVICGAITELPKHHGKNTISIKRFKFIGNDFVNLFSTVIGALVAGFTILFI
jgi:uncharacterized membrane protein